MSDGITFHHGPSLLTRLTRPTDRLIAEYEANHRPSFRLHCKTGSRRENSEELKQPVDDAVLAT